MTAATDSHDRSFYFEQSTLDDRYFRRFLSVFLLVFLVLGVVVPGLQIPLPELEEREAVEERLAQIVLKKKTQLSEPVKSKPVPVQKPAPVEAPEPIELPATSTPNPEAAVQQARRKAASSGLLQFQDDLAQMRDQVDMSRFDSTGLSRGQASASQVDRSLISTRSGKTSGGIDASSLSSDTGGTGLAGRQTTRVDGSAAGGGTGAGGSGAGASGRGGGGGAPLTRSNEEIRRVMDRNKNTLYAIYNRALRKDPLLSGKMTVRMVIEPSGEVSTVKLLESELADPALERKLLSRIRMIRFEPSKASATEVNYSFDFLPG